MPPLFAVTAEPLDVNAVLQLALGADGGTRGGVALFVGTVRDQNLGRRVLRLDYEAYEPLAVASFERIAGEIQGEWSDVRLALHHRVGSLTIGEASIVIAAASPHRANAFAACRYAIERVKQISPIWKREHFDGGDTWIEGATANPDDDGPRREARKRACA